MDGCDALNYDTGLKVSASGTDFKVVRPFTVVLCADGGSAGRKMGITDRPILFGNKLLANGTWNSISPHFLLFVYMSSYFCHEFKTRTSSVLGGISIRKFQQIPFPLPPYTEQLRMVGTVIELMSFCDKLKVNLLMSVDSRDELLAT